MALKHLAICFFFMMVSTSWSFGFTAYEIMEKVDSRENGKTQISTARMILIDKKDRRRIRKMKLFSKEFPEVEKSITFFISPVDVKGTSFLSYDWSDDNKEDDSWLYLPAMQQVNRTVAGDKSNSWMGSDFTFTDVEGYELNDYTYKLLSESDPVDGHDCWKIESTPNSDEVVKRTGYLKSTFWIRKDIFLVVRNIINVKKGKKVKYFSAKDIEQIDGIWTTKTIQMVTTKNKKIQHSSIFQLEDISYNIEIKDNLFEVESMQRGL